MKYFTQVRIVLLWFIPWSQATEFQPKTAPIDIQQQQHRERQRRLNTPHITLPVKIPLPPSHQISGLESPCFIIRRIKLEIHPHYFSQHFAQQPLESRYLKHNPTSYPQGTQWLKQQWPWLVRAADRCIGQCVGSQGITAMAHHLSRQLLLRGFITSRVVVPEQNIASGTLHLTVLPGFISTLRFVNEQAELSEVRSKRWQGLFPTGVGKLLNLRDLEQGLEQMSRLPQQQVKLRILPAQGAGGSEVIIITQQSRPYQWKAALQTSRSNNVQLQTKLTLLVAHPLDRQDIVQVGYRCSPFLQTSQGKQHTIYLDYTMPYGYWIFGLSTSITADRQPILKQTPNVCLNRHIRQWALYIDRVLYRDQQRRFSLQSRLGQYYRDTAINYTPIAVQKRHNTFVEFGFHYRKVVQDMQFNLIGSLRRGVPWLGAMPDLITNAPDSPTFFYQRQTLDAMLTVPFQWRNNSIQYSSLLRLQHSLHRLYDTEKLAIGGRYTVRGFNEQQQLSAENGLYWRNELEFPLRLQRLSLLAGQQSILSQLLQQTHLLLGLDYGQLYSATLSHGLCQRLLGSVLGLRGKLYERLTYEATVGWPLHQPKLLKKRAPVFTLQLDYHY